MRECTQTITVFNARLDPTTGYDVYTPTVIRGVSWFCETASTVDSSGLKGASRFTIRIPEDADFSGKSYVAPAEYQNCDTSRRFTLQQGDIIIHAAEKSSMRPAELQKKYREIVTILGVTDSRNRPRGKHWRVDGK